MTTNKLAESQGTAKDRAMPLPGEIPKLFGSVGAGGVTGTSKCQGNAVILGRLVKRKVPDEKESFVSQAAATIWKALRRRVFSAAAARTIFASARRRVFFGARIVRGSNVSFLTIAILFAGAVNAGAGPCTTQIAAIEQSIKNSVPSPDTGASAPQSVGAQLHHQPTPGSVEGAENRARADGVAALERARKADAAGDAAACAQAIADAKLIYGLN